MPTEAEVKAAAEAKAAEEARRPKPRDITVVVDRKEQPTTAAPGETAEALEEAARKAAEEAASKAKKEAEAKAAAGELDADGKPKKKGGMQARMDQLTEEKKVAERERDAAQAELRRVHEESLAAAARLEAADKEDVEPKKDDPKYADDPDAYNDARAEWRARKAARSEIAKEREKELKGKQDTLIAKAQTAWAKQLEIGKEKYPDWAEVEKATISISNQMGAAITTSEIGADLWHYLYEHQDEATRIFSLPTPRHGAEIGKLEEKLLGASRPKPSRMTEPLNPVGQNNEAGDKKPEDMTTEEYFAYRQPQIEAEARARRRPH